MKSTIAAVCVMLLTAGIYSSAGLMHTESNAASSQSFIGTTPDAPAVEAQAPTF